jgi:Ca-activated chloride channel family protein
MIWTSRGVVHAMGIVAAIAAAQSTLPTLRIAAPTDGTYVSGPSRIVAVIDPPAAVRAIGDVTFFADGRQVCRVVRPPFECDWDAGVGVAEHQIRVAARLRSGERIVETVRTAGVQYAESVDVDVIQVTAVVTDADGRFVSGLPQREFRVFEDGRPQEITSFASEDIPLELVAAIDVSQSMTEALPGVKVAAAQFLAGLGATDQVTVLGFNDNIFTLARRETNVAARARAIERLAPWGGTAVYDVIIKAIDLLGRQSGRRSIVLFSDGDDQSSHAPLDAAIARAEGSDATIYAIGQGRAVRASELQKLLQRLASTSGGRAFFTEDSARLEQVFGDILDDLRHQYVIGYPAPGNARDGAWHRITVEVGRGKYHVRAREGYRLR